MRILGGMMRPYDAGWFEIFKGLLVSSVAMLVTGCWLFIRVCPHFKNDDQNKINCSQTRKIAQIISGY